jgi:3-hydroxymyristoyl/3-hydroxydecanoyl-(acyl carrier protein) dehydratase
LGRRELEEIATMKRSISSVFGPAFARQDTHRYQLRIPAPPMMVTDRVLGIEGEPASLGSGRLWAEIDVTADKWGLDPAGYVSTFVTCESGQANMLLASWLGADLTHDGHLRYRLLDMDSELLGPLPRIGDTFGVEIALQRQAVVGGLRLFFFAAELRVGDELRSRARFTSGLFTEEDLERPTQVSWSASLDQRDLEGPFELPARYRAARSFSREALAALARGRVSDCFGPGFERACTHVRTPAIATEEMFVLEDVPVFDPVGGPWGRGYLRATQTISPDGWYFAAHLPGDPCLPGFLLLEAASQALSFYLSAAGVTLPRDGWRFEPLRNHRYVCKFRGQITPQSASIVHEVFVESLVAGPKPHIIADVVSSIQGRTVFHARRLGLRLVPDWPLEQFRHRPWSGAIPGQPGPLPALGGLAGYRNHRTPAAIVDGEIENDYPAMLEFAWGRGRNVFGRRAVELDDVERWPRLPGPPFLFLTRVARFDAEAMRPRPGSWIESDYEVPQASWFFSENGCPTMPFVVLLEAILQPCGWLMGYVAPKGGLLGVHVRNLDGTMTVYEEVRQGGSALRARTEIVSMSQLGGTTLFTLTVRSFVESRCVSEMRTTFGSFSSEALREQAGVTVSPEERDRIVSPSDIRLDLTAQPARFFTGSLRLAGPMLRMIDRVTALDPSGGEARLGWARAEKDVNADEWFFKAHFFQDPVQPGSLGLEALLQLLQVFMIERGLGDDIPQARFEPIAIGRPVTWKYRGQVLPESKRVVTEIEVSEIGRDEKGPFVVAQGWLWVDGVRVYHATNLGMRIVAGGHAAA